MRSFRRFLHNLVVPHERNRHRAKLLHNANLFIAIVLIIFSSFAANFVERAYPDVLGIASSISIDELVAKTNEKRAQNGLPPLSYSPQLSQAAAGKAQDMLSKNYWAHNAPDGTTPWVFFRNAGYNYIHAGENLARGFTDPSAAVEAWMASQKHRENILSANYDDIGFAVVDGNLGGEETVLIVEMFGRKTPSNLARVAVDEEPEVAGESQPSEESVLTQSPEVQSAFQGQVKPLVESSVTQNPLINSSFLTSSIARIILVLFVALFMIDLIVVELRRVPRHAGHSLDHMIFLAFIIAVTFIMARGVII